MVTVLGWFVLALCWWVIVGFIRVMSLFARLPRERFTKLDAFARALEASPDAWRDLWEGRTDWPSFENWFRARLAEEEARRASFMEKWPYDIVTTALGFVGLVLRFRSDGSRTWFRAARAEFANL
ncbi:MAG: hypothetical protein KDA89_03065 [Planctomycetaceae bacterium]|nr:hypothetical protein [Planctomycetaceae bacterium]